MSSRDWEEILQGLNISPVKWTFKVTLEVFQEHSGYLICLAQDLGVQARLGLACVWLEAFCSLYMWVSPNTVELGPKEHETIV